MNQYQFKFLQSLLIIIAIYQILNVNVVLSQSNDDEIFEITNITETKVTVRAETIPPGNLIFVFMYRGYDDVGFSYPTHRIENEIEFWESNNVSFDCNVQYRVYAICTSEDISMGPCDEIQTYDYEYWDLDYYTRTC